MPSFRVRHITALVVASFALAVGNPAAFAEDAEGWLQKMVAIYERAPFSLETTMEMKMTQGGQSFGMQAAGMMIYGDQRHMRMTLDMSVSMPGVAEGMKMNNLVVSDGTTMWTEMDNPAMGGKQVMKADIARVEELAAARGLGGMMSGSTDPVSQLRALSEFMDFKVTERSDGEVVLDGTPTQAFREQMGAALAMMGGGGVRLVLDEETGQPKRMMMGPVETPVMVLGFHNLTFLTKADLPAGVFEYQPPEGVRVIDAVQP